MNGNNEGAKPIPTNFHMVTIVWIGSGDLVNATSFVEKMTELHNAKHLPEGPDLCTFQTLLNAWKKSRHPKKNTCTARLEAKIAALRSSSGDKESMVALSLRPSN